MPIKAVTTTRRRMECQCRWVGYTFRTYYADGHSSYGKASVLVNEVSPIDEVVNSILRRAQEDIDLGIDEEFFHGGLTGFKLISCDGVKVNATI